MAIINIIRTLSMAFWKSDVVLCPNHCLGFFSQDVLRRPEPRLPSIFPCKMFCNRRYLSFCMTCPKYSNLWCFMVKSISHYLITFFNIVAFLTLSVQEIRSIFLYSHILKASIFLSMVSVSVHAPVPYNNKGNTVHFSNLA